MTTWNKMQSKTCKKIFSVLLVMCMLVGVAAQPLSASAVTASTSSTSQTSTTTDLPISATATTTSSNDVVQVDSAGGKNYPLFNSGRGTSSENSIDGNIDEGSFTNGGYDLTSNNSSYSGHPIMRLGLSFKMNISVNEYATITIYAYDIDENGNYSTSSCKERDYVYLIDETLNVSHKLEGYMSGLDQSWSTTSFDINPEWLISGHTYHFEFETTCLCGSNSGWWSYVRTVNLIVNGLGGILPPTPVVGIENADINASISASGFVNVDITANSYSIDNFYIELKAVNLSEDVQYGGKEFATEIRTEATTYSTGFQLQSGAPRGTYEITAYIKEVSGNVVATRSVTVSYGYSAVSYNANGGSQNLPTDNYAYSSGNTVSVKFDRIPSMYGYTFLGWSTDRNATEPMYTEGGVNSFTIGSSDVTLYAIWRVATCDQHTWVETPINNATCTTDGSVLLTCSVCGESEIMVIDALAHDYKIVETHNSTCTEDGYVLMKCQRNGCDAEKRQILPAPGHDFDANYVCRVCGFILDRHNHTYTVTVYEAKCEAMGYTLYACACGYSYRADYIDMLGHKWDQGVVTVENTCTTSGIKLHSCERCDKTYETIIPAGHDWSETVTTPATCTTDGLLTRVCYDCGATETVVIPAGHSWNEGAVITEPDCENAGLKICTCQVCYETKEFEIKRLGHNYYNGVCTRCGEKFSFNIVQGDHPEYGMYFEIEDIVSNYGPDLINEYGLLLDYNEGARFDKVAIYITQEGNMWRRCIACVGENIEYATYVPYLSYGDDIKYTGLNSPWINTFSLRENADGIWCYSNYATIGVNLEDNQGRLLLSLYDIGQAGTETRIFDNLADMIAWLGGPTTPTNCPHNAGRWVVVTEPTYTSTGLRVKRCLECDAIMETEVLPKLESASAKIEANGSYALVGKDIVFTLTIENCNIANALALMPKFDTRYFSLVSAEWLVEAPIQNIETGTNRAVSAFGEPTNVNTAVFKFVLRGLAPIISTTVGCELSAEINNETVDIYVNSLDIEVILCNHTDTEFVAVDGTYHNEVCTFCGHTVTSEHNYDGVCDAVCNDCGYERVAPHAYSESFTFDATGHWHVCDLCGAIDEIVDHNYTNYADGDCNDCGYVRFIRGDVDGDGDVDSDDAIIVVYNIFFGDIEYPVNQSLDFDGDGVETTDDGVYLLYYVFFGGLAYPLY